MLFDPKWGEGQDLLDLSTPSLKALSHILRDEELWPKGFKWNYSSCNTCAMGLAAQLWNIKQLGDNWTISESIAALETAFGIQYQDSKKIFLGRGAWVPRQFGFASFDLVTPEMVADQIDKYLASR